jgi:hypothetical protein
MKTILLHAVAGLVVPVTLLAQAPAHDHAPSDHPDDHAHGAAHQAAASAAGISERALEQIGAVERSVEEFATRDAARGSGFRPALGMIPTMGTHWVNGPRMRSGTGSELTRPEHLMFSPIDGDERLVGVAFAYQARPGQPIPDLFDGELDSWHAHPELSPPGQELTMLHVWFVPSPDGPFAGHNPWLPYWAVGLEPPEAARLADPADAHRIRALALALAETVDAGRDERLLGRLVEAAGADAEPRRERIRALIPVLEEAQGDPVAWNAAADQAVAEWEAIRAASLASIRLPLIRERLAAFYEEMLTGGHGAHAH